MQRFTSLCFQHAEVYVTLFLLSTNDALSYHRAHDDADYIQILSCPITEVQHAEIFLRWAMMIKEHFI